MGEIKELHEKKLMRYTLIMSLIIVAFMAILSLLLDYLYPKYGMVPLMTIIPVMIFLFILLIILVRFYFKARKQYKMINMDR